MSPKKRVAAPPQRSRQSVPASARRPRKGSPASRAKAAAARQLTVLHARRLALPPLGGARQRSRSGAADPAPAARRDVRAAGAAAARLLPAAGVRAGLPRRFSWSSPAGWPTCRGRVPTRGALIRVRDVRAGDRPGGDPDRAGRRAHSRQRMRRAARGRQRLTLNRSRRCFSGSRRTASWRPESPSREPLALHDHRGTEFGEPAGSRVRTPQPTATDDLGERVVDVARGELVRHAVRSTLTAAAAATSARPVRTTTVESIPAS